MKKLLKHKIHSSGQIFILKEEPTVFEVYFEMQENRKNKKILRCVLCKEELGEISDKNISHQCETHSCATE